MKGIQLRQVRWLINVILHHLTYQQFDLPDAVN